MNRLNLKLRFTLAMSIGVVGAVVGTGLVGDRFLEQDLRETMSSQQQALVQRAAADLDAKLRLALETLGAAAAGMPREAFSDSERFQDFYAARPALLKLFDDLIVLDPKGVITADFPSQPERIGLDLHERAFFKSMMATKKPLITEPLRAKLSGDAVVSMVVPILDARGEVASAMIGMLRLQRANFLGGMSLERLGDSGYLVVMTRGPKPVYLVHPEVRRALTAVDVDADPGYRVALPDAPLAGVAIGKVDGGTEALVSHRALAVTGWVMAAVLPTDEAFAAINGARGRLFAVALGVALVALPMVWLISWLLLRPLEGLRRELGAIADGASREVESAANRSDEVGEVARAFNALLARERSLEDSRRSSEEARERLVTVLEATKDFVAMTDTKGVLTYMNQAARNVCGLSPTARIQATTVRDYHPRWVLKLLEQEALPAVVRDGIWQGETAIIDRRAREIPVDHMVIAHRDADGRIAFFASIMHDIRQSKADRARIEASEAHMKSIADALPVCVAFVDREFRYTFVNQAYETHFGLSRERIVGRTVVDLIGGKAFEFYEPWFARAAQGEAVLFERESDSGMQYVHFRVKIIPSSDGSGEITGFHFIHEDITDLKVEQQRLVGLVHVDPLTGLMNRGGFEQALALAMQRSASPTALSMALFYLDIDRFKSINDEHGHGVGDALLKAFSQRIAQSLRGTDLVARLGGDEFVVIVEQLPNADAAIAIAEKVVHAVRDPFELEGLVLEVSTSVGVAVYAGEPIDMDRLVADADAALYRAKRSGRDRAVMSSSAPEREAA